MQIVESTGSFNLNGIDLNVVPGLSWAGMWRLTRGRGCGGTRGGGVVGSHWTTRVCE